MAGGVAKPHTKCRTCLNIIDMGKNDSEAWGELESKDKRKSTQGRVGVQIRGKLGIGEKKRSSIFLYKTPKWKKGRQSDLTEPHLMVVNKGTLIEIGNNK